MYSSAFVWAKILNFLEDRLTSVTVSNWFDDTEVVELTDEHLILFVPDEFRRGMIQRSCTPHIQDALLELFQSTAKLRVLDDEDLAKYQNNSLRSR